ncbi:MULTISPECIES: hypothetical protein [Rhizobium]|nr:MULTISPECIES: hypothetical protein [Rhizobium]
MTTVIRFIAATVFPSKSSPTLCGSISGSLSADGRELAERLF